ncbi:GNAT family N-acetyltransferase [Neotabrizicola shimadae]|uniref:GNAT family N-acetyltransferase n=1 Tax=Neotabrizicola shimadae TaxID=2807096 RepID=A0A8G1EDI4_9RHOB|nr:GNAT family N-acetyltransferase [Neotabrizicola shimadae]QYZ71695.1 GNAT family N-acetyltransferase [Neotabrizicola shimadae]
MSDTITLRLATPADLAAVDALLARAYPRLLAADYPPSVLVTAIPLIARARPELLASGRYWLACNSAGAVLAAGGWSRGAPTDGAHRASTAHIRHVVTDDRNTRRGLARAVLTRAMDQARATGVTRFDCWSTRTAERFYQSLGFTTLGPADIPLAPGIAFPAIRMTREG